MFGGDKTCISWLFVKHCEQADHPPAMQQHLEKVEAIEVLHCAKHCFFSSIICDLLSKLYHVKAYAADIKPLHQGKLSHQQGAGEPRLSYIGSSVNV